MKIRIYQIEMSLDEKCVAFMPYERLMQAYPDAFPAELYRMVYEYDSPTSQLSELFYIFNMEHPADYKARSMSVSDVIEVIIPKQGSYFYYVDSIGFQRVVFDPSLALGGLQNG